VAPRIISINDHVVIILACMLHPMMCGVLKQAGLVRDRHEGRQTHYSAQLGALAPLIDWTSQMAGFWQSRFDHLEDLLKRMDQ